MGVGELSQNESNKQDESNKNELGQAELSQAELGQDLGTRDRKPKSPRLKVLSQLFSMALALALFGLAIDQLQQSAAQYPPGEIWRSLRAIPSGAIALALGLTALNLLILTGYDTLALRYARLRRPPLRYQQTALVALIAYGLSNNIGWTFLSGGAVRYRFYRRWGVSPRAIAEGILFCSLSFWVGFWLVSGGLFLTQPETVAALLRLPLGLIRPLGSLCLAVLLGYLGWSLTGNFGRGRSLHIKGFGLDYHLPHLPFSLALGQIAVILADWSCVALLLYVLLPTAVLPPFGSFLGIYLLAKVAGVISNVPGGLGVFETVLLLAIAPPESAVPQVLGALLAYRGIYYWVPLAIALLAWLGYEIKQ